MTTLNFESFGILDYYIIQRKLQNNIATFYVIEQLPNNFQCKTLEQMGQIYAN
jgi:hypothetical protein